MRKKAKKNADSKVKLPSAISQLTQREKEIIILHMKGKNRKDIARLWNLAISTVDTHIKHIHLKTNTRDVLGVIKFGHDHHLDGK